MASVMANVMCMNKSFGWRIGQASVSSIQAFALNCDRIRRWIFGVALLLVLVVVGCDDS